MTNSVSSIESETSDQPPVLKIINNSKGDYGFLYKF